MNTTVRRALMSAFVSSLLLAGIASAQTAPVPGHPRVNEVDHRLDNQQQRIDNGVATPAITAALFARFVSQQDDSPAMKAVAAMRNQFGGHAVRTEAPPGGDKGTS